MAGGTNAPSATTDSSSHTNTTYDSDSDGSVEDADKVDGYGVPLGLEPLALTAGDGLTETNGQFAINADAKFSFTQNDRLEVADGAVETADTSADLATDAEFREHFDGLDQYNYKPHHSPAVNAADGRILSGTHSFKDEGLFLSVQYQPRLGTVAEDAFQYAIKGRLTAKRDPDSPPLKFAHGFGYDTSGWTQTTDTLATFDTTSYTTKYFERLVTVPPWVEEQIETTVQNELRMNIKAIQCGQRDGDLCDQSDSAYTAIGINVLDAGGFVRVGG